MKNHLVRPSVNHESEDINLIDWRLKDRLKTVSAAIVLCLNIGIDPPDIIRPDPSAKMEAWIDPFSQTPSKAIENIGQLFEKKQLQQQYEVWQPRARYKIVPDPSIEETKKLCCSLRRNAKDERILFHYNGHGVPKPTQSGEIWVFNKNYTQYIPISVFDIQSWLGSPCIYVYDCSASGAILNAFNRYALQRDNDKLLNCKGREPGQEVSLSIELEKDRMLDQDDTDVQTTYVPFGNCVQLAACGSNEILPFHPDLPADVFTSCLTTPISMGLRWFISMNPLLKTITSEMLDKIPGRLNDRRTPIGELNWIFTAITDTIAWNSLDHVLFSRLFRQDLMVAALFRNFLLADRVMRHYSCTPVSSPVLPSTYKHPMWEAWDRSAELCLFQLPALLQAESDGKPIEYINSSFFSEQLSAFEVWLTKASISRQVPEQLPIVLQVLLSQVHRLRALNLLSQFLDIGPWTVNQALSVGIFPYILKLLQSPALELKPVLIFIWSKIIAVDASCQNDLLKDDGYNYFIHVFANGALVKSNVDNRSTCAFILSKFCDGYEAAQDACIKNGLIECIMGLLNTNDTFLKKWCCLLLAKCIEKNGNVIKMFLLKERGYAKILHLTNDANVDVRVAAIYVLGILMNYELRTGEEIYQDEIMVAELLLTIKDGSSLVRKELIITLSKFIQIHQQQFLTAAFEVFEEEKRKKKYLELPPKKSATYFVPNRIIPGRNSIYSLGWKAILCLSSDVDDEVSQYASHVVDSIMIDVLNSQLMQNITSSIMFVDKSAVQGSIASTIFQYAFGESLVNESHKSLKTSRSFDISKTQISSSFFEDSCSFFTRPQMEIDESINPGSVLFTMQLYRQEINTVILNESEKEMSNYALKKFGNPIIPFADEPVTSCIIGTIDSHIIFTNLLNEIKIFDYSTKKQIKTTSRPKLSINGQITYSSLLNEKSIPLLLTLSNDGAVNIIESYDTHQTKTTGWKALPYIHSNQLYSTKANQAVKLQNRVFGDISQESGKFVCSGTLQKLVNVWDLEKELNVHQTSLRSSQLECLTIEPTLGNLIVLGYGDGCIQMIDTRIPSSSSVVAEYSELRSSLKSIAFEKNSFNVKSIGEDGTILLWDYRQPKQYPNKLFEDKGKRFNQSAAFHPSADFILTIDEEYEVNVVDSKGSQYGRVNVLNVLSKYKKISMAKEMLPILSFHSQKFIYAAGCGFGGLIVFAK